MGNDGMALLVVLGLGGLVLWYLTKMPANAPATTQNQPAPPCGGGYAGATITCAGVDYGLKKAKELGQGSWNYTFGLVLPESLKFGSTKVCRAPNGKDVFPNDIDECRKRYGIVDCNQCGNLYNLVSRKWPWTDELQAETQVSATPMIPVGGKPAGFR